MRSYLLIVHLTVIMLVASSSHSEAEGQRSCRTNRIYCGTDAEQGEFPSFIHLVKYPKSRGGFCGGSILDKDHVITTAHCITDKETGETTEENVSVLPQFNLRFPTADDILVNATSVERICRSPHYEMDLRCAPSFDFAILKLSKSLDLSARSGISAIQLPTRQIEQSQVAFAVGYGAIDLYNTKLPDVLQKVEVNRRVCPIRDNHPSKICFLGLDDLGETRKGDSGGPVLVKESSGSQTIYGITSYAHELRGTPEIFVDVYNMLEEINQLLAECS